MLTDLVNAWHSLDHPTAYPTAIRIGINNKGLIVNDNKIGCLVWLYVLEDPRTNAVRYVGSTTNPEKRMERHLSPLSWIGLKKTWFEDLRDAGLKPRMRIIHSPLLRGKRGKTPKAIPAEERFIHERQAIIGFIRRGCDLVNELI